jgi:hypothetical protein
MSNLGKKGHKRKGELLGMWNVERRGGGKGKDANRMNMIKVHYMYV